MLLLKMWSFLMLLFYEPLHIGKQYVGYSIEGEIWSDCSYLLGNSLLIMLVELQ